MPRRGSPHTRSLANTIFRSSQRFLLLLWQEPPAWSCLPLVVMLRRRQSRKRQGQLGRVLQGHVNNLVAYRQPTVFRSFSIGPFRCWVGCQPPEVLLLKGYEGPIVLSLMSTSGLMQGAPMSLLRVMSLGAMPLKKGSGVPSAVAP